MADPPCFSVIVPLFNKQDHVRRTLVAALAQNYPSFEVIVVDDASTDASVAAIADLEGDRVKILRQTNGGPGVARNFGCAHARGAWFAFLDADDLWSSGHLGALARIIAARPEARVVATASRQLPVDRAAEARAARHETWIRPLDYLANGGEGIVHTSSVAVRRDAFERSGGFGGDCPGEDEEFWARLALVESFAASDAGTSTYLRATAGIMDRIAAEGQAPITVATSPVGATLRAALGDATLADRHASIRAYLRRLGLRDARICIYAGHPRLARISLAASRPVGAQHLLYWPLAHLPARMGARLARLRGAFRR